MITMKRDTPRRIDVHTDYFGDRRPTVVLRTPRARRR
jgi:hypothetical protein